MAVSQNGYSVLTSSSDPRLTTVQVGSAQFPILKGDVAVVLGWVATQFHTTVEPLQVGQCWGYGYRQIRGGSGWSNHASGTAIDCNALRHPQGASPTSTFTGPQLRAINQILARTGGIVRWGGSYTAPTKPDGMHFEINATPAAVAILANLIREDIVSQLDDETINKIAIATTARILAGLDKAGSDVNNQISSPGTKFIDGSIKRAKALWSLLK